MRFMVILKSDPATEAGRAPTPELLNAMGKYNSDMVAAGVMLAGEGLHPSSAGARVRFRGDGVTVIDGPFTEAKELIAGFWLLQVSSLEEAVEWVKRMPNPGQDEPDVEVRRVQEAEDFGDAFTPQAREAEEKLRAKIAEQHPGA